MAVQNYGRQIVEENLEQAESLFKKYDLDQDGFLNREEVRYLVHDTYRLLNKDLEITSAELDQYLQLMDLDGDGRISEFDYNMHILESLKKRDIHL